MNIGNRLKLSVLDSFEIIVAALQRSLAQLLWKLNMGDWGRNTDCDQKCLKQSESHENHVIFLKENFIICFCFTKHIPQFFKYLELLPKLRSHGCILLAIFINHDRNRKLKPNTNVNLFGQLYVHEHVCYQVYRKKAYRELNTITTIPSKVECITQEHDSQGNSYGN